MSIDSNSSAKRLNLERATNFMRQFRDPDSRELKKLSANQFMEVWSHYDRDGNGYIEGTELDGFLKEFVSSANFTDISPDITESEVMFSQYAQNPYEGFSEMLHDEPGPSKQVTKEKKSKQRSREKSKKHNPTKSFVMSRLQRRGIKLIKISVLDLCNNNPQTSESDSDSENVIISAQYIVKDAIDNVMDETESLVKKISKSLIDSDF